LCGNANAQVGYKDNGERGANTEWGLLAGGSLYFGDLAADKRNYIGEARPHGGVFIRRYFLTSFSMRGNFYAGWLEGNDAWYDEPEWRKHRAFSFKSAQFEASVLLEYDLLRSYRLRHGGSGPGVYVFTGIGACYTNPQRNFNNIDASYFSPGDEALIGYEADFSRDPKHLALVVPVGLGVRYNITDRTAFFLEGSVRQGFDDKIDGFSNSVYSAKHDAYAFLSLGMALRVLR
jgi:hypothetical protein